jgi:hypothetical protein
MAMRLFPKRRFRNVRFWSNWELRRLAPIFPGEVVNVSAWDDRDKEGGRYADYFTQKTGYYTTNIAGERGAQGRENEFHLDLTEDVPPELRRRFDVALNHTTMEHIFDVRKAFASLCELSRDVVIVVVPFAQVQHECESYLDYWRLTPTCLRYLLEENGLTPIYESESPHPHAAVYLLMVGSRQPRRWEGKLPRYEPLTEAGRWIGAPRVRTFLRRLRNSLPR